MVLRPFHCEKLRRQSLSFLSEYPACAPFAATYSQRAPSSPQWSAGVPKLRVAGADAGDAHTEARAGRVGSSEWRGPG